MSWVKLDDQWYDHPKFLNVGELAQLLWVKALTYSRRYKLKGFVPAAALPKLTKVRNTNQMTKQLTDAALWVVVDGGWKIHDFEQYQPSAELSAIRAEAGKTGGLRSGETRSKVEANAEAKPKQSDSKAEAEPSGAGADARRAGLLLGSGSDPDPEGVRGGAAGYDLEILEVARAIRADSKLRGCCDPYDVAMRAMPVGNRKPVRWLLAAVKQAGDKTPPGEQAHLTLARLVGFLGHAKAPQVDEKPPGIQYRDFKPDKAQVPADQAAKNLERAKALLGPVGAPEADRLVGAARKAGT